MATVSARRIRILLSTPFDWEAANKIKQSAQSEVTDVVPDVRVAWKQAPIAKHPPAVDGKIVEITRCDFGPLLQSALIAICNHFKLKPHSMNGNVARATAQDETAAASLHGTVVNKRWTLRVPLLDGLPNDSM